MRLSEYLERTDIEMEKQAAFEEAETKDALEKRAEAIALGRALADADLGIKA